MELGLAGIALWTILWAFLNPLRGGQFKSDLPFLKALPNDLVATLIFAAVLALVLGNPLTAFVVAVAYKLGETFGWTRWLWAFSPDMTQERYNNEPNKEAPKGWANQWEWGSFIADKIIDPHKNYRSNAYLGFAVRSLMWWAPVYGALAFMSVINPSLAVVATMGSAILQPLCYDLASGTFGKGDDISHWIKRAEFFYGAAYGFVLGLALFL